MNPIVFDLDGTLIDSAPDIHLAVTGMLTAEGKPLLNLPMVTSFIGHGLPNLVKQVMEASGLESSRHEALTHDVLERYNAVNGQLTRLYPGVTVVLEKLKSLGHPLGLCTNKPHAPAVETLALVGISDYFDLVIGGDSLPSRKPVPDGLIACFAGLGGPGVYVGDSEVDADTAQNAVCPFALYTGGYRKSPLDAIPHDLAFDHFDELPDIVARLNLRVS